MSAATRGQASPHHSDPRGANFPPTAFGRRDACLTAAAYLWRASDRRQPRGSAGKPTAYPRLLRLDPIGVLISLWLLSAGKPLAHPRLSIVRPYGGRMPRGVPLVGAKMPMRGLAPNCGRQECRPSYGRCFLTWRIDYFRALALSLANTRKSETSDFQTLTSKAPPQGRLKMGFSPLYGTFRTHFSLENWPWIEISIPWIGESMGWKIEISIPWIGESMGWKSISMGCFGRNTPRGRISKAKRRTTVGVRFNALPHGAQACACLRGGALPRRRTAATMAAGRVRGGQGLPSGHRGTTGHRWLRRRFPPSTVLL